MQQNGVALIDQVSLTNDSGTPLRDLTLTVTLENGECETWMRRIEALEPGDTVRVQPDGLHLSAARLASRTEAERSTIMISLTSADFSTKKSLPIDLLAFDQWPGIGHYPELTAAFVTPNHPRIAEILQAARASLASLGQQDALDGYQSGGRRRATQIAEACFNAASARGIGYISPPASFERDGQRVRLVDRICRENFGTCLDLSLLLAGLWEQCGLYPLVLFLEGHAMPAVWTHECHLPEPAIDEPARIRNLIELGEIVPVESTLLTQSGSTFAAAVEAAKRRMASPGAGFCAIDIRTGRKRGIRPLPLREDGQATVVDLDALRTEVRATSTTLDRISLAERAEGRSPVGATNQPEESGADRIKRWQARLLDLSLRNRLINFRETGRTVGFAVPDVAALEDMLASEVRFSIHPKTDGDDAYLREELAAHHLHAALPSAEAQKRLLTLYRTAKASIEETGANLLHLAVGMLRWYESTSSETPRMAPLILLPVRLTRHATGSGFRYELSLSEEPLRPNVTLLEKLRTEFGIDTAGLADLPEDESGLDVPLILRKFRSAIRDSSRWEVEESVHLGLFSFNKFLMWRDLQENLDNLRGSRLVAHLVDRAAKEFDPNPFPLPDDLDDEVPPGEMLCTRDADSTQLAAIRAASEQRTFVLEGPPGTGKSQTIANIIADSLGRGKRVLFVAEKMAALTVVRRRLEEDGLAPFCLELHSAKATKKEVLAQLEEGLKAVGGTTPADWPMLCGDLGIARNRLNQYVRELHRPRNTGETLYQVLGRLSVLGEGARIALPTADVTATTREQLDSWRHHVVAMIEASASTAPIDQHPLRGIGRSEWSFSLPEEARHALGAATHTRDALSSSLHEFCITSGADAGTEHELSRAGIHAIAAVAQLLLSSPAPDARLIAGPEAPELRTAVLDAIAIGQSRDAKRSELLKRYRQELLEIDHLVHLDAVTRAAALPGPLKLIVGLFARRKIRPFCLGSIPSLDAIKADLEAARDLKQRSSKLAGSNELASILGRHWKNGDTDWAELEKLLQWCEQFSKAVTALARDPRGSTLAKRLPGIAADRERLRTVQAHARALVQACNGWNAAWQTLKGILVTSSAMALGEAEASWLGGMKTTLERWSGSLSELNDWCAWRRARSAAAQAGLTELIDKYESGTISRNELSDAFERSFGELWFNATANSIEAIRGFNAASHAKTIEQFRSIDKVLIDRTRHAVTARLSATAPSGSTQASAQSELGILRRELQKKRRHLPTRRLVEAMPTLLPRLKPCFLMSPLSVAQYLDAKLPPFDLVVFDEASQVPVWDAIGAIARGTDVVVVGDSKQLPPTSFFSTIDGDDDADIEDIAMDDMESILQECNASGIPRMHLKWHYRSRHESLIAFSNHYYYDNALHTFPSPDDRSTELGVTLRHIADGVYDRGGSRTNRIEAGSVVDEVVRLLREENHRDSIGIVTFSQAQQTLIEDLLDERRRQFPEIEPFFTSESKEPVFVKNLENVQGDERDTIIFSVGYGPDQTGKPSMNFGPLNKDGGERRLNVAVTRARRRLMVFSSLRSDQIDLRRTQSVGVKHFKAFLDYADRGPRAIAEAVEHSGTREFESGFEQAVWKALTERGWDVDTQVGCAGYRVDLAVRDPARPGRYLLGIECDGAAYHSAKTARDRDRLRQSVLEGLGWRIERIWSTEWRINRDRCLAAIEQALQDAKLGISKPAQNTPPPTPPTTLGMTANEPVSTPSAIRGLEALIPNRSVQPSQSTDRPLFASGPATFPGTTSAPHSPSPTGLPEYRQARPTNPRLRRLDIFDSDSIEPAIDAMADIVLAEGPIVQELAIRRLADWFGIQRVTQRFRDRFDQIRSRALGSKPIHSKGGVLWPSGMDQDTYTAFRIPSVDPDSRRDIEDVPLIERVNAVIHVLREQFGLPREALENEVARLFGVQRVAARARQAVAEAVDSAIAQGLAREANGSVTSTR
jgi:very-short-patch-repair endonuclease